MAALRKIEFTSSHPFSTSPTCPASDASTAIIGCEDARWD